MAKRQPSKTRTADPADAGFTTLTRIVESVNPSNVAAIVATANKNHDVTFTTRNVGRYTGMRIQSFQNTMLERNRTAQLDDMQLGAMMAVEFPAGVGAVFALNGAYGRTVDADIIRRVLSIVNGIRTDYNRTGHGGPKPTIPVDRFGASRFDVETKPASTVKTRKSA